MSSKNALIKLIVGANTAAPTPPVGPALGSKGLKAIDFCRQFNARTAHYVDGVPIPCLVVARPDRTFTFDIKSPPTGYLLLKAAGLEKGSDKAGVNFVGEVSLKHVYEIAKIKKTDNHHTNIELKGIVKSIIGVARSMGINVVN